MQSCWHVLESQPSFFNPLQCLSSGAVTCHVMLTGHVIKNPSRPSSSSYVCPANKLTALSSGTQMRQVLAYRWFTLYFSSFLLLGGHSAACLTRLRVEARRFKDWRCLSVARDWGKWSTQGLFIPEIGKMSIPPSLTYLESQPKNSRLVWANVQTGQALFCLLRMFVCFWFLFFCSCMNLSS